MNRARLCSAETMADNTIAMFTANGVDVLLLRIGGRHLAIAPLCPHMKAPLQHGCFEGCFDASTARCNRVLRQSLEETGEPLGIADAPLLMYECVVEEDGFVYVDLARQLPLDEYQHITCSPSIEPGGVKALIVNLWRQGFVNEKDVVQGGPGAREPGAVRY